MDPSVDTIIDDALVERFFWRGGGAWSNLSGSWNEERAQSQLKGFTIFSTEKSLTHLSSSINKT